jgi:hypothetical protein
VGACGTELRLLENWLKRAASDCRPRAVVSGHPKQCGSAYGRGGGIGASDVGGATGAGDDGGAIGVGLRAGAATGRGGGGAGVIFARISSSATFSLLISRVT